MKICLAIAIILELLLAIHARSTPESPTYNAGVVEFAPTISENVPEATKANLDGYLKILEDSNNIDLDIIVFPEAALNDIPTAVYIPEPSTRTNPCDNVNYNSTDLLKLLSCAAKKGKRYVVINLTEKADCPDKEMLANKDERECPDNKLSFYNVNIVFDRNGVLIARYRKFHLFKELVNHPKYPEIVTFDTDFGVKFGTFICFDIVFADPPMELVRKLKITDIIHPSFWLSEMPHGTALQVQQNWAFVNDVNLLASGASVPLWSVSGSGIYAGKLGPIQSTLSSGNGNTKLYTATVPKRNSNIKEVKNYSVKRTPKEMETLTLFREEINDYKTVLIPLNQTKFTQEICQADNQFCCKFNLEYNFEKPSSGSDQFYQYRAVVFAGERSFQDEAKGNITSCYITACQTESVETCATRFEDTDKVKALTTFTKISISGLFPYGTYDFVFPNSLDTSITPLLPSEIRYELKDKREYIKEISMELRSKRNDLLTFGLYGRHFVNAGEKTKVRFFSLILSIIAKLLCFQFRV